LGVDAGEGDGDEDGHGEQEGDVARREEGGDLKEGDVAMSRCSSCAKSRDDSGEKKSVVSHGKWYSLDCTTARDDAFLSRLIYNIW
jgi:hypothetical protein